jgi:hypothetical protein
LKWEEAVKRDLKKGGIYLENCPWIGMWRSAIHMHEPWTYFRSPNDLTVIDDLII